MNTINPADQVKSLFEEENTVTNSSSNDIWNAALEDVYMGKLFGWHNLVVSYYFTPGFHQPTPIGDGTVYPWIPPEIEIIWVRLGHKDGTIVTGYIVGEDALHNLIIEVNHEGEE